MASRYVPLIAAILLIGLFATAIINFGIMVADQNDASINIGDDPAIINYYGNVSENLIASSNAVQSSDAALTNSSIQTSGSTFVDASRGIWKSIRNAPTMVWNLTFGLIIDKLFGGAAGIAVAAVVGAILGMILFAAVIRMLTQGDMG